jgi:hypothetical protein
LARELSHLRGQLRDRDPVRLEKSQSHGRDSSEGQQYAEFADVICDLMADVQLDAAQRRFIWPDGELLDLDQSVAHIQEQYPDFRRDWIEEYLIDWIDMAYAPEHYSREQLDELDRLTAPWIADHLRHAKTSKKRKRVTLELFRYRP